MTQLTNQQTASVKLGCRFTESEARLLDLVSIASGETASAYFRKAVKRQMLDDLLMHLGHNSTARTPQQVSSAIQELRTLVGFDE